MLLTPVGQPSQNGLVRFYFCVFEHDVAVLDGSDLERVIGERLGFDPAQLGRFVEPIVDFCAIGGSNHDGPVAPSATSATRQIDS